MASPTCHREKGGVKVVDNLSNAKNEKPGGHYIFRRYIVKNGRRIYPRRGRAFQFWVES